MDLQTSCCDVNTTRHANISRVWRGHLYTMGRLQQDQADPDHNPIYPAEIGSIFMTILL